MTDDRGFMLHSGQSFPGTPDWLCSRTGTGPERQKRRDIQSQGDVIFVLKMEAREI